jgi:hypothetical protein
MQLLAKMESGKIHADELLSVRGGRGAFAAAKITECFVSRKRKGTGPLEESHMRLIFGVIIGCLLTIGGAYVIDTVSPAGAKQMVNWDVVATNFDSVTALARKGWKKITGLATDK